MKKEKDIIRFGTLSVNKNHQLHILETVALLSTVGWKIIKNSDWDNLTQNAPIFKTIAGENEEEYLRFSRACVEIFSRWQAAEKEELGADLETKVYAEDIEDLLILVEKYQKENGIIRESITGYE